MYNRDHSRICNKDVDFFKILKETKLSWQMASL